MDRVSEGVLFLRSFHTGDTMITADHLINTLEGADHQAHFARVHRGRYLLPLVQVLTGLAVAVARRVERANR